ncbi:melanoma-associated antigen B2-like [Loxodonta africana]|uniref:melanoma-associated antigen B2-like n=1 Tax=Loxodonta africana TaxID=9785 RepID=UPI000C8116B5|nr:melanoma-associated antigen B2-like [Loxodonta africana]
MRRLPSRKCREGEASGLTGLRLSSSEEGGVSGLVRSPASPAPLLHSCLFSLSRDIMPHGHKSKLRYREKRRQAQGDTGSVKSAQGSQRAPSTSTGGAGSSGSRAPRGAEGQDEGGPSSSSARAPNERSHREVTRRVIILSQFLLSKYEVQECLTKGKMMKIINKGYKEHFPEILRRASEYVQLAFGLDVKEVDSKGQSYTIVSKLEITEEENLSGGRGFPKKGLLMPLLAMIYTNGNRASEEEMWEFLNMVGMYDGKTHFLFGEPRKLITKDLVQEKYLEYRQVPNSDPPRYQFLWGPRAQAEAIKTKVLEFLAKDKNTFSSVFQALYGESWGDEEERAAGREWAGAGPHARARASVRVSPAGRPIRGEV